MRREMGREMGNMEEDVDGKGNGDVEEDVDGKRG